MPLDRDADYVTYLYTCNRCRSCAVDPTPEMRPLCPAHARFGFFTYSGGGKGYVAQGILEGKTKPSPEAAEVAMNCLVCGACAGMCPPGFDTLSFIRDLRDHLVGKGFFINEKHRELLERARSGDVWGKPARGSKLPVFTGAEEIMVFLGCRERARGEVVQALKTSLDAAGVTWGVLQKEPCCGAPLNDLGDRAAFEKLAEKNIELLNGAGAERILVLCPHCAATLTNDYFDVGDLEPEIVSLPRYLAEIVNEGRLKLSAGKPLKVTFHDPCRLSRFLEEEEESRNVIASNKAVELLEMDRAGKSTWCCGSGAWAAEIVPELARYTSRERVSEARATGADLLVTACSYCTDILKKSSRGKPGVVHIAEFVEQMIQGRESKGRGKRKRVKKKS